MVVAIRLLGGTVGADEEKTYDAGNVEDDDGDSDDDDNIDGNTGEGWGDDDEMELSAIISISRYRSHTFFQ